MADTEVWSKFSVFGQTGSCLDKVYRYNVGDIWQSDLSLVNVADVRQSGQRLAKVAELINHNIVGGMLSKK